MNNNTILRMSVFLITATLLVTVTTALTMVPAAYAEGDDDDDNDHNGDGNKQKAEDESAGAIADCDDNNVETGDFECVASSAGVRFTGQDVMINGISATLLSDEVDPSAQEVNLPIALPLPF
jgi:hypothetical protein